MLVSVGLNQAAAAPGEVVLPGSGTIDGALSALSALDGIEEVAVLSTCRRVEVYALARCPAAATLSLRRALAGPGGRERPVAELHGADAFRALVRATAGLDPTRAGEPRTFERVATAFQRAVDAGTAGRDLAAVAARALQAARRVSAEGGVDLEGVSWGRAVTALAEKVLGPLGGRPALVLGAGEEACHAARHLAGAGASVVVVDHSLPAAAAVAGEVHGAASPLDALGAELARADVVVATAPVAPGALGRAAFLAALRGRPRRVVVADLAAPRAVSAETGRLDDVYLCDADDLRRVLAAAIEARAWALLDAERIVEEEVARWRRDDELRRASRPDPIERAARDAAEGAGVAAARPLASGSGERARTTGAA